MKKWWIALFASLVLLYGWNAEKVSFSIHSAEAAKTPDFTARAKKEAVKVYPLSQVMMVKLIFEQTKKDQSLKQYHLTLAEGQKTIQVIVVIHYKTGTKKVHSVQVHEMK
ncbi:DUF3889 domain-containing protein [Bacillus sp. FJAT-42376]|uniref:DUF3889 domain-containing protein n=1 Tax=Bacillus sp. FJAT-42376 TaxID=2014076 RepID=UPI000F4DA964|nr:DUF3889 domain-containing protein [Bacillus sp. FJAT-42376]AZB42224.1 DUF3889 domain-containing protein [Bacillus sp. FJAT-42376]